MPEKIQRVPRGLNDLLALSGGQTPQLLADEVRPTLDLLQLYGLTQAQTLIATNAAAAEGATVGILLSATQWTVLFAICATVAKTATMTALEIGATLQRQGVQIPIVSRAGGPFGATETGAVHAPFFLPYPTLCPPGTVVGAVATIIGTDATASVTVRAEVGFL